MNINVIIVNSLRYADDTVLLADTIEGPQNLLDRVVSSCIRYALQYNMKKSKLMVVSMRPNPQVELPIGSNRINELRHPEVACCIWSSRDKLKKGVVRKVHLIFILDMNNLGRFNVSSLFSSRYSRIPIFFQFVDSHVEQWWLHYHVK